MGRPVNNHVEQYPFTEPAVTEVRQPAKVRVVVEFEVSDPNSILPQRRAAGQMAFAWAQTARYFASDHVRVYTEEDSPQDGTFAQVMNYPIQL
jgi:hypothetical protein